MIAEPSNIYRLTRQLKVNAERYVLHPSCYVVTGGMC